MKKEYRLECRNEERWGKKWVGAIGTNGGYFGSIYTNRAEAEKALKRLVSLWEEHELPCYSDRKTKVSEFRIVSRTVTEWEPEEE